MKHAVSGYQIWLLILAVVGLFCATATQASAQEEDVAKLIERGRKSYLTHCGSCHGMEAKGDGVIAPYMKSMPSDLTQINEHNQGEFPFDAIYDIVDGRDVPGHGTRVMPVWGPAFMGMDETASKKVVKEKVIELVYYLKSIQPPISGLSPMMGGDPN
ncbi:MAG: cytochrome c [bacterium]|nr:cytochrome c [bacterium]